MTHSAAEAKTGTYAPPPAPKHLIRVLPSRAMLSFVAVRLGTSVIALFVLATVLHFYIGILMPGDYASQFFGMPLAQKEALRQRLGLDLPEWQQYLNWLGRLARGDLGDSFRGGPVLMHISAALPRTLVIFLTGLGIAFALGHWLGKAVGWRGPGPLSDSITVGVLTLFAFFPPSLAFIMNFLLADILGVLPRSPETFWREFEHRFPDMNPEVIYRSMVINLIVVTVLGLLLPRLIRRITRRRLPGVVPIALIAGGWLASWFALGYGAPAVQLLRIAAVPIFAVAVLALGDVMVISRASMVDTLHEQYVQTARAKGLREGAVRDRHAGPNAFLPVLSKMVISLPYLLGGLAIIEYATQWQGIGGSIFSAAAVQDVPLVMGYLLFLGLLALVCRLVLDILYAALDPRIRFGSGE